MLDIKNHEEELIEIYPKLIYYASCETRRKGLSKDKACDLVHKAIELIFTGKRKWDREKVDLLTCLKGVIRSSASHEMESADTARRYNAMKDEDGESLDVIESAESSESTPLEEMERKELEEYLWSEAGDDDDMKLVLLCLFKGERRQDIAKELNLPVSEVDNIMKRVRRATKKFLNQSNR